MRQSQLKGRSRLRELRAETKAADVELDHERRRFEMLAGTETVAVQVDQHFPTPPDLAARVIGLARIRINHRVLEPSAGTGALLKAVGAGPDKVAVEINPVLVRHLMGGGAVSGCHIICGDFLQETPEELGLFHRVVMNPPFRRGTDIKHIQHARKFLKPGGRLVAICANGPRQREKLQPAATSWIDLPAGSFQESGTNVNAAIVVIDA